MKITVNGKELDLIGALPITLGDVKRLQRTYGVSESQLAAGDVTAAAALLLILIQKLDPAVSEDHLDSMPLSVAEDAFRFIGAEGRKVDRPT